LVVNKHHPYKSCPVMSCLWEFANLSPPHTACSLPLTYTPYIHCLHLSALFTFCVCQSFGSRGICFFAYKMSHIEGCLTSS